MKISLQLSFGSQHESEEIVHFQESSLLHTIYGPVIQETELPVHATGSSGSCLFQEKFLTTEEIPQKSGINSSKIKNRGLWCLRPGCPQQEVTPLNNRKM